MKNLFYYLMVENQNIENKPTYGICKEFCHLTSAADLFTFQVPCCYVRYDFGIKTMFGSSLPPVVVGWFLFTLFVFVYVLWCPTHICFVFLRLVYHIYVSLDCPFLIAPLLFSNVYLILLILLIFICSEMNIHWLSTGFYLGICNQEQPINNCD